MISDVDHLKKVTWLLPVLNGMPYLVEALASIEVQTFRDFEVLAWDNGSTDGGVDILKEWIPKRLPGRVFSGKPLSLGACLAEMVLLAETPLCARMDADDVNDPGRLTAQVAFLDTHPDVVAVGAQVVKISRYGERGQRYHQLPTSHENIVLRMIWKWSMWHPTVLFRRAAVLQAGNYFDERPTEDYSLWLRMARVGRLANLDETLLDYRVHEESITERSRKSGELAEHISNCVATHGPDLYGLPAARLELIHKQSVPMRFRDWLAISRKLVTVGYTNLACLAASRTWWELLRSSFEDTVVVRTGKRAIRKLNRHLVNATK